MVNRLGENVADSLANALEIIVRTDTGRVRGHNEDSVFANAPLGLAILADGMGGYNAGEVASGMATTLLSSGFEAAFNQKPLHEFDATSGQSYAHRLMRKEIAASNVAIFQAAERQPQYAGMGTTLVTALFHNDQVTVAHIGDSRLYCLRGEQFSQLTRDHSLLQEQIDRGLITPKNARRSQNKNLVTRALGVDPVVDTEIHDYPVLPGDIYLLCSDGLNDMLEDEEIHLTLQSLASNLELAALQLIQKANNNGGRDNISVVLVKILRPFPLSKAWWSKLATWF
jgi:PPM family protein phosphatase